MEMILDETSSDEEEEEEEVECVLVYEDFPHTPSEGIKEPTLEQYKKLWAERMVWEDRQRKCCREQAKEIKELHKEVRHLDRANGDLHYYQGILDEKHAKVVKQNRELHENIDVAVNLMDEDRQALYFATLEGNPHAEEEEEVKCHCSECGADGKCIVSLKRSKELAQQNLVEDNCPFDCS